MRVTIEQLIQYERERLLFLRHLTGFSISLWTLCVYSEKFFFVEQSIKYHTGDLF